MCEYQRLGKEFPNRTRRETTMEDVVVDELHGIISLAGALVKLDACTTKPLVDLPDLE